MAYSSTMVMAETSIEHYNFYKFGWFIPTLKTTSLKHHYILFIELIVPSVATFDYL
jgi:hypothetical protein